VDERLSRLLAFVLRHHPEEADLALDEYGAAGIEELVAGGGARPGLESITRERIERLVADQSPPRFEILGDRIRARYGHSLAQPIRYEPADPPDVLFHGTSPETAETILTEGLKPAQHQYVHLSSDTPTAHEVGSRHCPEPVILQIDTASARKGGVRFYPAGPTVWLSDPIPPECITRAE
jgi:putative RNA 2'-phosphotransferase